MGPGGDVPALAVSVRAVTDRPNRSGL